MFANQGEGDRVQQTNCSVVTWMRHPDTRWLGTAASPSVATREWIWQIGGKYANIPQTWPFKNVDLKILVKYISHEIYHLTTLSV